MFFINYFFILLYILRIINTSNSIITNLEINNSNDRHIIILELNNILLYNDLLRNINDFKKLINIYINSPSNNKNNNILIYINILTSLSLRIIKIQKEIKSLENEKKINKNIQIKPEYQEKRNELKELLIQLYKGNYSSTSSFIKYIYYYKQINFLLPKWINSKFKILEEMPPYIIYKSNSLNNKKKS